MYSLPKSLRTLTKHKIAEITLSADAENKLAVEMDIENVYCHDDERSDANNFIEELLQSDLPNIDSRELGMRDQDIKDRVR